jgi:hypothetical protein
LVAFNTTETDIMPQEEQTKPVGKTETEDTENVTNNKKQVNNNKPAKKSKSSDPPRKRGPPRPHKKLPQDVLEGRICKLRKRIERARGQLEDAERHIEGYDKEAKFRVLFQEQEKKN